MVEQIGESTIRSRVRRQGYVVKKSRRNTPSQWESCGYTLIRAETNMTVVGPYLHASLGLVDAADLLARFESSDGVD